MRLLDEFTGSKPSVIPFLIEQLENETTPTRIAGTAAGWKAAWILSKMGTAARPAMPALMRILEDDDERAAESAADALGAIGPEAKAAVPTLIAVLERRVSAQRTPW